MNMLLEAINNLIKKDKKRYSLKYSDNVECLNYIKNHFEKLKEELEIIKNDNFKLDKFWKNFINEDYKLFTELQKILKK